MKKLVFILAGFILTGFTVNASPNTTASSLAANYYGGYGNSFIFVEDGIEFSVFRDGQFDFNILRNRSQFNVSIGSPNVRFSFNSGFDYNAFVQYDEFGAIIQIEHIPIFYDHFGRIVQAGNVNIFYNNFGYVSQVGGLFVHYNGYNRFTHCTGFINIYNRRYVYRPWHRNYIIPALDYCVVYNRPYRRFYNPVRYVYSRPYYNNFRPRTSVALRRGNAIRRNRNYATAYRSPRNRTTVNNFKSSRRLASNDVVNQRSRNNSSSRRYIDSDRTNRTNNANNVRRESTRNIRNAQPKTRVNSSVRRENNANANVQTKTRIRTNSQRTVATTNNSRQVQNRNSATQMTRNRTAVRKPINNNSRIYNTNRSSRQTVNRTSQNKPRVTQRSNTRSRQSNSRATQSRTSSRSQSINSSSRRRS